MSTFDAYYRSRVAALKTVGDEVNLHDDGRKDGRSRVSKAAGVWRRKRIKGLGMELTVLAMLCLAHDRVEEARHLVDEAMKLGAVICSTRSSTELRAAALGAKAEHARWCGDVALASGKRSLQVAFG